MDQRIEKVLLEIENLKASGAKFWNVPKTTGLFLNMMVRAMGAKKILEVGTSNGYSGIYLAEAVSHNQGLLYTVESHEERFELAAENFKKTGLQNFIVQVKGHAPEILIEKWPPSSADSFDLIFIDATKLEYQSYMKVLLPKLRVGGLMIADNCISHGDGLADFFKFIDSQKNLQSLLLSLDNGLLTALKLADSEEI